MAALTEVVGLHVYVDLPTVGVGSDRCLGVEPHHKLVGLGVDDLF